MVKKILSYLWYPLFFALAIAMFSQLLNTDMPLLVAVYVPIILTGATILLLEYCFPERLDWRPNWLDIKADIAFMLVVQIVVPRLLLLFTLLLVSDWTHRHAALAIWPHELPLAAQVLLMVLLVDLVRYWLHRACHRFNLLWRLHEVHHSPDILYLLNVGRFHPLEKLLHFCLDSVPFLLLGVTPEVLAGYFLLYSVNGFFQHSNLQLRYGWLNYVVGSAETHRWHHAKDPKTASCNFGNTTIVWDLLFGTWFLPKDQHLGDIGIPKKNYPKSFLAQMWIPFHTSKDNKKRIKQRIANFLISVYLKAFTWLQYLRIRRMAVDPKATQWVLLERILRRNADTHFGRQYRFADIECYAQFVEFVPVCDYEKLRPFIELNITSDQSTLTQELPAHFVRTSGTTGKAKDIPLLKSHLHSLRLIQKTAVAFQHRQCPAAFSGSILAITSPSDEGELLSGKRFGSASGFVARNTPWLVRKKFVLPPSVFNINDSRVKYLLILRLALVHNDITYMSTANATTLLALMELYREHQSVLINDLHEGGFFLADKIPPVIFESITAHLIAAPARAQQLQKLAEQATVRLADLWPDVKLLVTWSCASAGVAVNALKRELSTTTQIMELGYIASEMRGTVTLGRRTGSGFPTLDTHFFEFVARNQWDSDSAEFLTLEQLCKGVDYYVIVTTPSGLYRYFMNDLVRVTGFLHNTPLLKFVQKGKGVTNITGEKLYEAQVLAAVNKTLAKLALAPPFFMMLADEHACQYRLYLETMNLDINICTALATQVDDELGQLNVEYKAKRESGRLGTLQVINLKSGTAAAYKQHCVVKGQREGQFKVLALVYKRDVDFDLDAYMEVRSSD